MRERFNWVSAEFILLAALIWLAPCVMLGGLISLVSEEVGLAVGAFLFGAGLVGIFLGADPEDIARE